MAKLKLQRKRAVACARVIHTIAVQKKIVVDEQGAPIEVILPWATFCNLAETLGLDLDEEAEADLRETRRDLGSGERKAFSPLALSSL